MLTEEQYPWNRQAEACFPLCQCLIPRGRCPGRPKSQSMKVKGPYPPSRASGPPHTTQPCMPPRALEQWIQAFRLHYTSGWEGEPSEASASVMDVRLRLIRERQWLLWGSGGICGLLWQCGVVKNPPAKQEMGV